MITQSELKQVLHYEPDTGVFTWVTDHAHGTIKHQNKYRHLGLFDCPAAASFAYQIAADRLFCAHARVF